METGEEERLGWVMRRSSGGWGLSQEVDSSGSGGGQEEGLLQAGYYRTQRESGEITVKDRKASDNPLPESQPGVAFESESLVENGFEGQWLTQRIEPDKRGRL